MAHADKEFYYASRNLALEIKGKFIGANTRYIPLKPLEFQSHQHKIFNPLNLWIRPTLSFYNSHLLIWFANF